MKPTDRKEDAKNLSIITAMAVAAVVITAGLRAGDAGLDGHDFRHRVRTVDVAPVLATSHEPIRDFDPALRDQSHLRIGLDRRRRGADRLHPLGPQRRQLGGPARRREEQPPIDHALCHPLRSRADHRCVGPRRGALHAQVRRQDRARRPLHRFGLGPNGATGRESGRHDNGARMGRPRAHRVHVSARRRRTGKWPALRDLAAE